jgi:hypothetical protein
MQLNTEISTSIAMEMDHECRETFTAQMNTGNIPDTNRGK